MEALTVNDLAREFLDHVYALPQGDKVNQCLQCGTCTASCPASDLMDYGPREIIASLRAGFLDKVLGSNTMWLCVSCYFCTVRCPVKIPFTEIMYELKRLAAAHGLSQKAETSVAMNRAFVASVNRHGRNVEVELLRHYYLHTNPVKAVGQIPLGLKLLFRGRLKLGAKSIKGLAGLRKMLATIENGEER